MSACAFHIRGQKTTLNSCDVYVFDHQVSTGERRNGVYVCVLFYLFPFFFCFPHRAKLQRQADITLQSQDPTFAMCIEVLIFLGSYWQRE